MIDVIAKYDNIMPYIHLPLQSGSDRILKLMGRRYTKEKYLELFNKIKGITEEDLDFLFFEKIANFHKKFYFVGKFGFFFCFSSGSCGCGGFFFSFFLCFCFFFCGRVKKNGFCCLQEPFLRRRCLRQV